MLRILHTSDWHLGHTLHHHSREHEHAQFLSWLLERLEEERVDALLVAGDIFHTANPSSSAQAMFYGFIESARRRLPKLDVVIIGGNHDSASRLDAPGGLFALAGVHVVGGMKAGADEDLARALVEVRGVNGERAWVAAVPFLKQADFDSDVHRAEGPVEAFRQAYAHVVEAAVARRGENEPILAMGHCYMTGGRISSLSERDVTRGAEEALPVDVFGAEIAYCALGHLHLAQQVGYLEHVRYSGSPIPLSMTEVDYCHQVIVAEFEGAALSDIRSLVIPRTVELMRIGHGNAKSLKDTLDILAALELPERPLGERPLVEISVLVDPAVHDRAIQISRAVSEKSLRLARIVSVHSHVAKGGLGDALPQRELVELAPEEVFVELHRREHGDAPDAALTRSFRELETLVMVA